MSSSTPKPPQPGNKTQGGSRNLLQNVIFGGVAGVIGQSCVFPMYTVKTRLQTFPGRYNSVFHCARKIVQHEGLRGLYRGLPPALTGVFPEKAIKLSVNDYLTAVLSRADGSISLPMAMLAGGGAGLCQVIITNPMELVMIKMQDAAAKGRKHRSMFHLARDLGLSGLYKGTQATLLRDIPFSMVFFSMNTYMRSKLTKPDGTLPISKVFLAGIVSGSTAATLSTPMDVIKTRLQASASDATKASSSHSTAAAATAASTVPSSAEPSGAAAAASRSTMSAPPSSRSFASAPSSTASLSNPVYTGVVHCAKHIYATEGIRGFFSGTVPRVLIISPLFGITLFFYDIQRRLQASGKL